MRPTVLVLFNTPGKGDDPGGCSYRESEGGVAAEVAAVEAALRQLEIPFRSAGVHSVRDLDGLFTVGREPVVVNLVEALDGLDEYACLVPDICRSYGCTVTGNSTRCLALTLDKAVTKSVLRASGIPTPWWVQVSVGEEVPRIPPEYFPLIVKPSRSDASEGIDAHSVIGQPGPELAGLVDRLHRTSGEPVLVERYLEGREFNVALLEEAGSVRVLPPAEILFKGYPAGKPRIVDYAAKWLEESFEYRNTERQIPAQISDSEFQQIRDLALRSWTACGCRDYARVDFRMEADGRCSLLEVNANPDVAPDAGFSAALDAGRIGYPKFVATIVDNARSRHFETVHLSEQPSDGPAGPEGREGIFRTAAAEVGPIVAMVAETGFFRPDEVEIAAEVLESAVHRGDYESYTFRVEGAAVGWVCYGATPCTMGTYDVYWLAVSPGLQGRGIGHRLMDFAEARIREAGGRIAVVETAGRPDYEPTRKFYERIGYLLEHQIIDFYAPGDDKMIYCKRF